jgi:DNA polymerase epsilon subunit 4
MYSYLRLAAQAVIRQESLEFLEDVIPRTAPYKQIKEQAAAAQAKVRGEKSAADETAQPGSAKKPKSAVNGAGAGRSSAEIIGFGPASRVLAADEDPDAQLQMEMRRAETRDEDVVMLD